MRARNTSLIIVIILIVLGIFVWEYRTSPWLAPLLGANNTAGVQAQVGKTSYQCDANKTILATYYASNSSALVSSSSTPPAPNGSVALILSDGRSMTLPQTISGSGIRYASADNSVVFWSKGNTAFITEGSDQSQSYANCIAVSNIVGQESWKTYADAASGYSIRYPDGYTLDTAYVNDTMGQGKSIKGIKITIPPTMATGTNLSNDTGVSVQQLPKATTCSADLFLGDQTGSSTTQTDNGVTYSVAHGSDAGAGNLYSQTVYALPGTSPCTAVLYFVHSTQLGNYPPGSVKAFDQTTLINQFDSIRRSLVIGK